MGLFLNTKKYKSVFFQLSTIIFRHQKQPYEREYVNSRTSGIKWSFNVSSNEKEHYHTTK